MTFDYTEGYHTAYAAYKKYSEKCTELEEENKTLKEALKFYADTSSWSKKIMRQGRLVRMPKNCLNLDGGDKAREALYKAGKI